jgi:hypothetical protein
MSASEYDRLCTAFMKTFASVPDPLRSEIILVIEGKPYTWETVFIEVRAKTELSKKMLEALKRLKIIE